MGVVDCCIVLHCLLTGKWPLAASPRFLTPCALVWPSSTWHLVGLCPTDGGCVHRLSRQYAQRGGAWFVVHVVWFTFDGSDDADPLCLADKSRPLDAQVVELQRDGIATPTVTVEVECFLTGDGKGMCAGHRKLKCRCWHCDLAFQDFGGDNIRPSDFIISIRWGAFLCSIPPTRRVGDMLHCCCRIVNAIFKRLSRALDPLLRSVVQSVMQAAAPIPSEIRDAPRPTKDGNFDLAGGRWFA